MIDIGLAALRIPKVMADEFQQQRFRRRPGQRLPCRRQSPGFEIGQIRGQRPERVGAHALVNEMAQRLDILVGQQLGEFVAALDRQHRGNGFEFFGTSLDGGQ